MAFTEKKIEISFSLSGAPLVALKDKRISCKIVNAGDPSMGQADVAVFGMTLSDMNALSTIGTQLNQIGKNTISIKAGEGDNLSLVFEGTIIFAWVDGQSQPDVPFRVTALAGAYEAVAKAEPTSVDGSADVAQTIEQIAQKAGLQFENNGVSVKISNPYLPGTAREQILSLARAAGIETTIENGTVAIWKAGESRSAYSVALSPETGLVGYPAFNQAAIIARALFNPDFRLGGSVTLKSQLTPANGTWTIFNVAHDIESQMPNGAWFTTIQMTTVGGGDAPGGAGV